MADPAAPVVQFLIPADRAEVVNGKLYMMGGCWDRIQIPQFPSIYPVGLAIRVSLPGEDSREDHTLGLTLLGPDGADVQPHAIQFVRQAVASDVPVVYAVFGVGAVLQLTGPGTYTLSASVDGGQSIQTEFTVETDPTQI